MTKIGNYRQNLGKKAPFFVDYGKPKSLRHFFLPVFSIENK
jgi:hypothetical protein